MCKEQKLFYHDPLYHYCSLQTFYSIIKNKSIWLSDLSKTNDSMELVWMKECVEKPLLAIVNSKSDSYSDEWNGWRVTKELLEHAGEDMRCWGFCLSEKGDDLGQWRGYGDDGAGVSIGFKYDKLNELLKPQLDQSAVKVSSEDSEEDLGVELNFGKVQYKTREEITEPISQEAKKRIDDDVISSIEDNVNSNRIKGRPPVKFTGEQIEILARESLSKWFMGKEYFCKMKAFEEEDEWRIVFSLPVEKISPEVLKEKISKKEFFDEKSQYFKDFKCFSDKFYPENYEYIVKDNMLVSHLEIKLKDLKDLIHSITIGPKSKVTEEDIKLFLKLNDVYSDSIVIGKSGASYR